MEKKPRTETRLSNLETMGKSLQLEFCIAPLLAMITVMATSRLHSIHKQLLVYVIAFCWMTLPKSWKRRDWRNALKVSRCYTRGSCISFGRAVGCVTYASAALGSVGAKPHERGHVKFRQGRFLQLAGKLSANASNVYAGRYRHRTK